MATRRTEAEVTYTSIDRELAQVGLVVRMLLLGLTLTTAGGNAFAGKIVEVVYRTTPDTLKEYLCRPSSTGPFPAVQYNHGGVGHSIGGAPKETCEALATAGFVGFAPIRRQTHSMAGHLDDVQAGLNYLLGLDYVDRKRVAMAGFSRGGRSHLWPPHVAPPSRRR